MPTTESESAMLRVDVWRGGEQGEFVRYQVPKRERQTVLDAVTWIQRRLEPALAYRFACRVGMCGSCAMTVNGRPRWTCRTLVSTLEVNRPLRLAPLKQFPIIKDLVVDMSEFFTSLAKVGAGFESSLDRRDAMAPVEPNSEQRIAADAAIECINCGACHSACTTVGAGVGYVGPAALNRAWSLVNDERHTGRQQTLVGVLGPGGCTHCHTQASCTAVCPVGLDPSRSVAGLKRVGLRAYLRGELR